MKIQVVAAWPDRTLSQDLQVSPGTELAAVRSHPDLLPELCQAWDQAAEIGIFGARALLGQPLEPGDRIELWRPLQIDPKDARRAKAAAKAKLARIARAKQKVRKATLHKAAPEKGKPGSV
jgi:putative ubiquitin-RnfH superfamily antitoxin RatB of RatAB toxin-antitoxin module